MVGVVVDAADTIGLVDAITVPVESIRPKE